MKLFLTQRISLLFLFLIPLFSSAQPQLVTHISSASRLFTVAGSTIYYVSNDSLFKNTGTGASQFVFKSSEEIIDGPVFQYRTYGNGSMAVLGNTVFFITKKGTNELGLWRSNGTAATTKLVSYFKGLGYFKVFKNKLYFAADDGIYGGELWAVDETGIVQRITDLNPGSSSALDVVNAQYYYSPDYTFDTTNDYLFFSANNGQTGRELWKTTGAVNNATQVIDLIVGPESSNPIEIINGGNTIYFIQDYDDYYGSHPDKIWKTDGTQAGTSLIYSTPLDYYLYALIYAGNHLHFLQREAYGDAFLGSSDGTPAGTKILFSSYAFLSKLDVANGKVIVAEWGGDYYISSYYISDGNSVTAFAGNFGGDYLFNPPVFPFKEYILFSTNTDDFTEDGNGYHGYKEATQYELGNNQTHHLRDVFYNKPDSAYANADNYFKVGDFVYFTSVPAYSYYNIYPTRLLKYKPIPAQTDSLKITSLTWVDATTDQDKGTLLNGSTIGDANTLLKNLKRNIRANTSGPVKSVKFIMNGQATIQNTIPFAYAGYSNGDYLPWIPSAGINEVSVIPYSEKDAKGREGKPFTVSFNIIAKEKVVSFTLINADTDADMRTIVSGDTIGSASILTKNNHLNIRANIEGEPYKIFFSHEGDEVNWPYVDTLSRTTAPYTLAGYNNSDYLSFSPKIAKHILKAIPVIPTFGNGGKGKELEIVFYVRGADKITDFVLVKNGPYDSLRTIKEGDIINIRDYPSVTEFNIKANTNLYGVQDVLFIKHFITPFRVEDESMDSDYAPYLMFDNNWWDQRFQVGDYKVKATPYTKDAYYAQYPEYAPEFAPFAGKPLEMSFRIIDEAPGQRVLDYYLMNADDDSFFKILEDGDSLDLATLPKNHNVKINTYPLQPGSVKILYDGSTRVEQYAPFALFGDSNGNLNPGQFTLGMHTLTCIPYTGTNGGGTSGVAKTISFYVYDSRACSATGSLVREYWANVSGSSVASIPVHLLPTSTSSVNLFEGPTNAGDNYGARYRGYICPPTTGNYIFWIASDDNSELWLSTDGKPVNKVKIASVTGTTISRQWDKYPSQKSVAIALIANKKYYIEALHKEATGTDNLAVGWQLPNTSMERPIPGSRVSPFKFNPSAIVEAGWIEPLAGQSFNSGTEIVLEGNAYVEESEFNLNEEAIFKVEFFTGSEKIAEVKDRSDDYRNSFKYNWKTATVGKHSLYIKATDINGTLGYSDTIDIYVFNTNQSPSVSITSPVNNTSYIAPASVVINANASLSGGSISKVEFYQGTVKLGEDNSSPYSFTWTNVAAGNYVLTAKAYSSTNASTTSEPVNIIVENNTSNCSATGTILREYWANTSGSNLSGVPVNTTPTKTSQLSIFEGPMNDGANYGSRVRGYICVPISGAYIFWISSNDNSELYLSTDENPVNKIKVAFVTGFTNSRQWDKYPSQKSGAVNLIAGKKYYIEAIHIQNGGTDNLAVGWQLPNAVQERPIPSTRISPFSGGTTNIPPTVSITSPVNNASYNAPASVTINATASDSDGSITKVEFYQGATKLGEDNTSPYSFAWTNVAAGNYTLTAKAFDNGGASTTSNVVNISVQGVVVNCTATGTILREFWNGVSGTTVATVPVHLPPTSTSQVSIFEGPSNVGTNYGARYRGYLCVPATGNYTFWIASNDESELWLSTSEDPAAKVKIAYVTGSTNVRQWDKFAFQKSTLINLQVGKKYYIEALHKQGVGTDNLAVGWQLPDGTQERPMPGNRLSPYTGASLAKVDAVKLIVESDSVVSSIDVTMYPNPTQKGIVTLAIEGYEQTKHKVYITVVNQSGNIIHSEKVSCEITCRRTIINIDEKFAPGIYIFNVVIDKKIYTERLIVE